MYELGVLLGILIAILYSLSIAIIFKIFRFDDKLWKYFLAAFSLGVLFFFIGIIRKIFITSIPYPSVLWVSLILTGFIEELMKLIALYIIIIKLPVDKEETPYYGLLIGLGFGAGEMLYILPILPSLAPTYYNAIISNLVFAWLLPAPLSDLFWYYAIVYTNSWFIVTSAANIFGISLVGLYERLIVTPFHAATAILIGQGFKAESPKFNLFGIEIPPKINYYLLAVGLHISINLFAVFYNLMILPIEITEIIITAISIPTFIIVTRQFVLKE
ncbi:MAG: hypothetical protein ACTSRG_22285 [Candidatus Helarchaeota archaeon]